MIMDRDHIRRTMRQYLDVACEVVDERLGDSADHPSVVAGCMVAAAIDGLYDRPANGELAPLEAIAMTLGGDQLKTSIPEALSRIVDAIEAVAAALPETSG